MLAKALAKELQIPFLQVAKKTKYTLSQLHFDRKGRETNLKNAFECLDLTQIPLHSSIVIVDDVTTTGSTILELSKVIVGNKKFPRQNLVIESLYRDFPGCLVVKNLPSNVGNMGSIPDWATNPD